MKSLYKSPYYEIALDADGRVIVNDSLGRSILRHMKHRLEYFRPGGRKSPNHSGEDGQRDAPRSATEPSFFAAPSRSMRSTEGSGSDPPGLSVTSVSFVCLSRHQGWA